MAHGSRPTSLFTQSSGSSLRQPSTFSNPATQNSSILAARVAAKKAELEDLRQLREISHAMASQMEILQQKLETLRDGAEAVACVMSNWENVLSAINMASMRMAQTAAQEASTVTQTPEAEKSKDLAMPSSLVRIPAEPSETRARNDA